MQAQARAQAQAQAQDESYIAKYALTLAHDGSLFQVVKRSLEEAPTDKECLRVQAAFHGHVWEALACPHASQILETFIFRLSPASCQFILDEIARRGPNGPASAARMKYGERVLEHALELFEPEDVEGIVGSLLAEAIPLAKHAHGSKVLQCLLQNGPSAACCRLVEDLTAHAAELCVDGNGCRVLAAALKCASAQGRPALASAILQVPDALVSMARTRRGHGAALAILDGAGGPEARYAAAIQLCKCKGVLRGSRFGRSVFAEVEVQGRGNHSVRGGA